MFQKRNTRKIFFVTKSGDVWGSTSMRSEQLINVLRNKYADRFLCEITSLPDDKISKLRWVASKPRGSVIIFTKNSINQLNPRMLDLLHLKGCYTCLDYVDSNINQYTNLRPTVHIAASFAGERDLKNLRGNERRSIIFLLHHMPDLRALKNNRLGLKSASTVYFGMKAHTVYNDRIEKIVDFIDGSTVETAQNNFHLLDNYNFHYCVRFQKEKGDKIVSKPFTKGFIASYYESPVIFDINEYDAKIMLGEDYPFIVRDYNTDQIYDSIIRYKEEFGRKNWIEAENRMKSLKAYCSPESVSSQFCDLIREFE